MWVGLVGGVGWGGGGGQGACLQLAVSGGRLACAECGSTCAHLCSMPTWQSPMPPLPNEHPDVATGQVPGVPEEL